MNIKHTPDFEKWLKSLKDRIAYAKVMIRLDRIKNGNFGDVESVGNGVSELRIHHGKGYRVYFANKNNEIILLLIGGDKSSQQADIKKAKLIAQEWGF